MASWSNGVRVKWSGFGSWVHNVLCSWARLFTLMVRGNAGGNPAMD